MKLNLLTDIKKVDGFAYPFTANLLSALYPHKFTTPWINSNFIQICFVENLVDPWYSNIAFPIDMQKTWQDFYMHQMCPFIENTKISKEMIDYRYGSFQDFIKFCMNRNWFILTPLNKYYIPFSDYFEKENFSHYTFISGIDTDEGTVRIADFYNQAKYAQYDCPLDLLEKAYETSTVNSVNEYEDRDSHFVQCYKVVEPASKYIFDINLFKIKMYDFLESKDSFARTLETDDIADSKYWFGLEVYKQMIECAKNGYWNMQSSSYLLEHKILQGRRLEFLVEKSYLSVDKYNELASLSLEMQRTAKLNLQRVTKIHARYLKGQKQIEDFDTVVNYLSSLFENDKIFTEKLLKHL